jgi:hypothetical protein
MRKLESTFAILCVLLASSKVLGAQHTCHAASGDSNHFLRVINAMMTADQQPLRTTFGLPLVTSSQITLVTDPTVCGRAGQALDSLARAWVPTSPGLPPSTTPLYVFQIGTSYGLVDLESANENDADFIYFFGSLWNHTGIGASQ